MNSSIPQTVALIDRERCKTAMALHSIRFYEIMVVQYELHFLKLSTICTLLLNVLIMKETI